MASAFVTLTMPLHQTVPATAPTLFSKTVLVPVVLLSHLKNTTSILSEDSVILAQLDVDATLRAVIIVCLTR